MTMKSKRERHERTDIFISSGGNLKSNRGIEESISLRYIYRSSGEKHRRNESITIEKISVNRKQKKIEKRKSRKNNIEIRTSKRNFYLESRSKIDRFNWIDRDRASGKRSLTHVCVCES